VVVSCSDIDPYTIGSEQIIRTLVAVSNISIYEIRELDVLLGFEFYSTCHKTGLLHRED
jgi:hypothetical protein